MAAVIAVCAWAKHQHYKDRDPPWIKLYRDLLSAESWVLGTDDSRLVQVASMLLAARYRNAIPLNYALFRKVASLDLSESRFRAAVDHLASTGFLEIQGVEEPRKQRASSVLATCTSEAEQSRAETEQRVPTEPVPQERDREAVDSVFECWKGIHGHPKARLDDKRRRLIRKALASYTVDDLCACISGYKNSPHHMGQNDRSTVYDDIEIFLRDAKHIDAGIKFLHEPPRTDLSSTTRRNVIAVADWVPPEARNARA